MIERARHFVKALGLKSKNAIEDVRLTGGNASYTYTANSDLDVTIMLNRELNLSTQEVRRLGIACSLLNYKLNPKVGDIDLNFFISSKNVGGTVLRTRLFTACSRTSSSRSLPVTTSHTPTISLVRPTTLPRLLRTAC